MDNERLSRADRSIRGLIEFARANFPRSTDIRIETIGCDPSGSVTVSANELAELAELLNRKSA